MKSRRFRFVCFLICLPALALCGLGAYFLYDKVPKIAAAERGRLSREYRSEALALAGRPDLAERLPRTRGWRERGKVPLADGTRVGWGYVDEPDGRVLVWIAQPDDGVRAVRVEAAETADLALLSGVGIVSVLVLCVGLTAFSLWFFVATVRARDDFLAATAHDLTTPLVGLRRLVGRDAAEERAVVERMLRLVGNLKDFLRLGGRRAAPARDVFAIGAAFDAAYALFAADYAEEASGPVAVTGDRALRVRADETLVVQILWNLLGNDLKYAAPSGLVSIRFASSGNCVAVEISDVGPGMKPREMKRAFDRYYRAKTVLASGKGGFGIGLCTAREFARAMGGELAIRANAPHGCVFTLTLPAEEVGPRDDRDYARAKANDGSVGR